LVSRQHKIEERCPKVLWKSREKKFIVNALKKISTPVHMAIRRFLSFIIFKEKIKEIIYNQNEIGMRFLSDLF